MHDSVVLLARYNQQVNLAMLESLTQLSAEQLRADRNIYFKSPIGLVNHILNSDRQWLSGLLTHLPEASAAMRQCPEFEIADFMAIPFPDLDTFHPQRIAMDACMIEYIASIPPARMREYVEHPNWKGRTHRLRIGSLFVHLFNHHTHHRGQLSALLDQYGIEHDWSNLVFMLPTIDPPPD